MKRCVSCNAGNSDDAVFCRECGLRFGAATQEDGAALSMPETGSSAPEEINGEAGEPILGEDGTAAGLRYAIPPTPEPVLPKSEDIAPCSPPAPRVQPQKPASDVTERPTQQFQTVPSHKIVYDPAGDIQSLRLLYKKKYPALGVLSVLLRIGGWLALVLYPVGKGITAAFPEIFDPYWYEEYAYYPDAFEVAGSVLYGLLYGAAALVCCYALSAFFDYIRDREREGRIQTDIMLRTLNKK